MVDPLAPTPAPEPAKQEPTLSGTAGLLTVALRVVERMTNERLMLVSLIAVLGFVVYYGQRGQQEQTASNARLYEEGRETDRKLATESRATDRKHCDDREDRAEARRAASEKEMRAYYAAQDEANRKNLNDREDKMRMSIVSLADAFDKYRQTMAGVTQSIADLIAVVKKP